MKRISSTYAGKCCVCDAVHMEGAEIFYDAAAVRGKRSYCIPCGERKRPFDAAKQDAAAELAELKAKLAKLEDKPVEAPKPTVSTTNADPLAMAIAKAIEPMIAGKLDEARVREIIAESVKPPVHEIVVKTPDMPEGVNVGRQHKQFEELLIACNARTAKGRLNVWITGAAGTGKTTAAEMVAKALDLEFASTGSLAEIYKVMGHRSPGTGEYVATHFRRIWENGGVFLFDDFDASDPSAVIEMNQPLANCLCAFEDGMVRRHPDTVIILTANTWGHGATDDYCGRLKQDKAFLDRFVQIDWEIDEDLERETCSNLAWVEVVQRIRANVKRQGMKVLVTPRASYHGAALLEAGLPMDKVARMTIRKGMTDQQWSSVC